MKRLICYVTGTRADFGLIERTLIKAAAHPKLAVSVCVTGMHLSAKFGKTIKDIERTKLKICAKISVDVERDVAGGTAIAIARELEEMVIAFRKIKPSILLLLGDRGEMLAGAVAALHLNIPVIHIHGGERSGTVDEPIRHAISKLSHYHFTSTTAARDRLVRMGELAGNIFVTGAPGIDGILQGKFPSRKQLCQRISLDYSRPIALIVFHPVPQSAVKSGQQMKNLVNEVLRAGLQAICFQPNSDFGSEGIIKAIQGFITHPDCRKVVHMEREVYLAWLNVSDLLIGNSSSGIIEAASFGIPVVNIGERQQARERNHNTIQSKSDTRSIRAAISKALKTVRYSPENIYGEGRASDKIVDLLASLPLGEKLLYKSNAY